MNIFVLHTNPRKAARYHADKHVIKMLLESVQMLYTAHWIVTYPFLLMKKGPFAVSMHQKGLPSPPSFLMNEAPKQKSNPSQRGYRPVHIHHPCTKWVRCSLANYMWLCQLALELSKEFTYRFGSIHSCDAHVKWLITYPPPLDIIPLTKFAEAMPDLYKRGDPIKSYRAFYRGEKTNKGITKNYTKRHKPHWLSSKDSVVNS